MQMPAMHTASAASPFLIIDGPVTDLSARRRTATEHSPRLLSRRNSRKLCRQRSSSGRHAEMISPEEYEALPPSIQRKYFSPKERMHIAQQAATNMRKRQSIKGSWLAPPTPTGPVRPSTSACTTSSPSSANQSKVSLVQADQDVITEDQARWFLMLPDKVRKQHFSREEQVVLMIRCKKVLEHVSPETAADVYRHVLKFSREDCTPSFTDTRPSTSGGIDDGKSYLTFHTSSNFSPENADWEIDMFRRYSGPNPQPPPASCATDEIMNMTSIPPSPPEPSIETLNIYKSKRKSFMRRHSLTPLPLPAPTLAPLVPPVPRLPSMEQVRHFELSAKQSRSSTEQGPDLLEPPKKYYRDQDARSKLRSALVSAEKFDEALAFGFLSTEDRNSDISTDSTLPLEQPALYHSEQEYDDNDDLQSTGTHGPRTPTPTYLSDDQPAIKQTSFDSGVELPYTQTKRPKTSGSAAASPHNREMTIHMTLTRRDLRSPSPEEQLYSVQRFQNTGVDVEKIDPLALEPLPVSDDASGAHGAFAMNDGIVPKGLKRVWKSLVRH